MEVVKYSVTAVMSGGSETTASVTVTKRDKDLGLVQGQHRTMAPGYHSLFHLAIDRGYPFS